MSRRIGEKTARVLKLLKSHHPNPLSGSEIGGYPRNLVAYGLVMCFDQHKKKHGNKYFITRKGLEKLEEYYAPR